jgi:aminoglycoside phosphotransferase (APT) family kinase protein
MTNVPVPNVIAYDKSREIVESDFFLSDLLPGRPLNLVRSELDEETQTRVDRQIGTHLKEIHQIQGPQFGTYNLQEFVTWSDAFTTLMDWLRKDASDLKVDLPHRAFEAAEPHLWALDEVKSPTLVHWDLWDGNIFVDTATGTVTGYIDFERVLWADPLIETNFGAPRPAFVEAYGSEILQSPGADSRRKLYQLYLYLIMVIECHFRHFTHEHETEIRTLLDGAIARCRA